MTSMSFGSIVIPGPLALLAERPNGYNECIQGFVFCPRRVFFVFPRHVCIFPGDFAVFFR